MNIFRKILLVSILVAWTSVFFKYKTSAFLSSRSRNDENTNDQTEQSRRVRQTLRDAYHRVVDPKSNKDEESSASNFRVRQTIRDQYHRLVDGKINNKQPSDVKAETKKPSMKNEHRDPSSDQKSRIKKAQSHEIFESLARRILSSSQSSHKKYNNHNYNDGYYNNYNYRPGKYGEVRGTLCTNYLEYDGIVFGQFYCPIEGFEYDETMCCGALKEQYCCSLTEYNSLKGSAYGSVDPAALEQKRITRDNILFFMIIAVPIIFMTFLIVAFLIYFLIVRKSRKDDPLPIYSSQIDNKDAYDEYEDDEEDEEAIQEDLEVNSSSGDQSKLSEELKLK